MKRKTYMLLYFFLTITPFTLWSQQQIKSSVVANGSSTLTSESNQITGTIGQSLIGKMTSPSSTIKSGFWEQVRDLITSVELTDDKILVNEFNLYQNYPNPFNPSTIIQFAISKESFTKLEVFNAIGEKVSTLVSGTLSAGIYQYAWNTESTSGGLPSGVYFYRLTSGNYIQTKKLLLMK